MTEDPNIDDIAQGEDEYDAEGADASLDAGDVGARDGVAAAGSEGAVSEPYEGEDGGVPTEGPDPTVGPD